MKNRIIVNNEQFNYLHIVLLQLVIYNKSRLPIYKGILFKIRSGVAWRDIPDKFGNSNTIFKSVFRW